MIPSLGVASLKYAEVYQRGLVIDSQLAADLALEVESVSKGIGD